ncbi:MAG: DUF721 domain-containing protein [Rhizobiales bacterium]|jgi:hypothetical protein|nr:DUF721 domain-containing protein [Hyphomicrobiales bacterium]
MAGQPRKWKGTQHLGELVARVIEPVTARRGFANADLLAIWPEIAGPMHAACTAPEKIMWPRHAEGSEPPAGTLVIRADGPRAVFLQHELPQIVERVNAFFGYRAVASARIIQGRVVRNVPESPAPPRVDAVTDRRVASEVAHVENEDLRAALHRLGQGVFTRSRE